MQYHDRLRQQEEIAPAFVGCTPSPDPGFVRKLKAYSPDLDIRFSRNWGCFVITQKSKMSGDVPLIMVKGDHGGGYRQPDDRDMMAIYDADRWNRSDHGWKDVIDRGEKHMLEHEEIQDAKVRQEIRDVTVDDKIQLMNTYKEALGMGKTHNEFERVQPKSKSNPSQRKTVKTYK